MRTHERVLAQIEADLAAGRWALGERLPGERALADEIGVSRASVREAIRILEAVGIVRTAVGSGPTAGATVVDRPAAGLSVAVRLHVASGTLPVSDVVATRVLLETWAIREAAERAGGGAEGATVSDGAPAAEGGGAGHDPDGEAGGGRRGDGARGGDDTLAEARRLLAEMEEQGVSAPDFIVHDQDFHLEFARIAGNQVVEAFMLGLRGSIGAYVAEGVERLPDWAATSARLRAEHRAILDAVAAGDGPTAERLTREHIEGFYAETGLAGGVESVQVGRRR
ncbi:FadR/GntR family transcriptional regulator [Myceligenerans halotolerans]